MTDLPNCINCGFEYIYEVKDKYVCPECSHEWLKNAPEIEDEEYLTKDANRNILRDGDTVIIVKDLKIKGSSSSVKVGTKVKNIRLVAGDHDIDCKIPGFGAMGLKSEFVKKA